MKSEKTLTASLILVAASLYFEHAILQMSQAASLLVSLALIGSILMAALRVAHHAEVLAEKFGEPYGTMVLTLSAVLVEVVILAFMMSHTESTTLVRDTIYSAVMLDINGILGIAALIGGLKHGEQPYNVDSGNTYLVMIAAAMGVSMIIPEFLPATNWKPYSLFTIGIMALLYAMFLRLQTKKHSYFFAYRYAETGTDEDTHHGGVAASAGWLACGIVVIGLLSEVMSQSLNNGLAGTGVPPIVAALVVAFISASPELLTALRASMANRMQPVVNIAMGASLSTVILTVPVIEILALSTGKPIEMGLTPVQTAMLTLTVIIAAVNLNDGETNAIEGMTHMTLFATFLMLTCLGM
jgi:Ca2+:H+ antiporter